MAKNGESSYRCFLSGQMLCLEEFITIYSDSMVRFAYSFLRSSEDAEDVACECVSRFFMRTRHFADETRLRAYVLKSVRNRCMDLLRKRGREVPLEDVENVLGGGDVAQATWKKERDKILYECMQRLPRQYAMVLQLRYLEDFSVEETQKILGANAKQVYNLLSRAKIALKQELEKEGISHEDIS